jgi:hypothetical protein
MRDSEAMKAALRWNPLSKEEVQAERASQLLIELENAKARLGEHDDEREHLKEAISDLKKELKTAKRLSKKQRARINTLEPKWRKQWVKYYDENRAAGKSQQYASALAWTRIKIHCRKDEDQIWRCPEWESVYKQRPKHPKRPKKPKRKKAKKGP